MKKLSILLGRPVNFFYLIVLMLFMSGECFAANGFDFPVGIPDGDGYKNGSEVGPGDGWGYLEWNGTVYHPGEDWNRGFGSTDYDDPLYSIGDGEVVDARNYGGNWGKIVLIKYSHSEDFIWAQYAHLNQVKVTKGDRVSRGELIGTIGDAGGRWASHLHFEVRIKNIKANYWPAGLSKDDISISYAEPSKFISENRPLPTPEGQVLSVASGGAKSVNLSWTKCEDSKFARYELYRSTVSGGTADEAKREKIFSSTSADDLVFNDSDISYDKPYYYRLLAIYSDGRVGESEEVSITIKREIINITNDDIYEGEPRIGGGKIVWRQMSWDSKYFPKKSTIHYYDIENATKGEIKIGNMLDKIEGPDYSDVSSKYICYSGRDGYYASSSIFCHVLESGIDMKINLDHFINNYPRVSESDYLVWQNVEKQKLYYTNLDGPPIITAVNDSDWNQSIANIWGSICVWYEVNPANINEKSINVKNVATGEMIVTLPMGRRVGYPDVWDKWVTWDDDGVIYLYNYETKEKKIVSEKSVWSPAIDNGKIVFSVIVGEYANLAVYDIETEETIVIDFDLRWSARPVIWGDYIAFQAPTDPLSDSSSSMDIWLIGL